MGDWQGHVVLEDGTVMPVVAQVIARGNGAYTGRSYPRFDARLNPLSTFHGQTESGTVTFSGSIEGYGTYQGKLAGEGITGAVHGPVGGTIGLRHLVRLSPTLGAKAPAGAVVLFDGTTLNEWKSVDAEQPSTEARWTVRDGVMEVKPGAGGIVTKKKFTDFQMHLEFRTPFMPEAEGQDRGNSGVYMQGRYEIQVLDSYGLEGEDNECGGIYKVASPAVNMCAPPGQWQTYDITFKAPRFDNAGKKVSDALLTVMHNGVTIHDRLRLPGATGGSLDQDVHLPGGIHLQDHGNLVQYRNIWLKENQ